MPSPDTGAVSGACVVMPVWNEDATICAVLDAVREHFAGSVVVVDDGSTDRTRQCLESRSDIEVVCHAANEGYGASLLDGISRARELGAAAVVTMDCDGQHEPHHIPEFVARLADADIVSGSRYLPESDATGEVPAERADVNRRVTEAIVAVTGWSITDSFCGFKAYRAAAFDSMDLRERGYGMPLELWAQAWRAGLRVVELPVERIYFDGDRSFGEDLDDATKRLGYYMRVWSEALERRPAEDGGSAR